MEQEGDVLKGLMAVRALVNRVGGNSSWGEGFESKG